jgi:hypothetical protein
VRLFHALIPEIRLPRLPRLGARGSRRRLQHVGLLTECTRHASWCREPSRAAGHLQGFVQASRAVQIEPDPTGRREKQSRVLSGDCDRSIASSRPRSSNHQLYLSASGRLFTHRFEARGHLEWARHVQGTRQGDALNPNAPSVAPVGGTSRPTSAKCTVSNWSAQCNISSLDVLLHGSRSFQSLPVPSQQHPS